MAKVIYKSVLLFVMVAAWCTGVGCFESLVERGMEWLAAILIMVPTIFFLTASKSGVLEDLYGFNEYIERRFLK